MQETQVQSLGQEDSLEKGIATHSRGFPDSSVGKESACSAGDSGSTPGSGRSTAEGIGYPLQYSWASLVTQLVKNLPAMWETWVQSLGWERSPEEEKGYPLIILAWRIPAWGIPQTYSPCGHSQTRLSYFHFLVFLPGESHGQRRNLGDYSLWGHKRVGHNLATKQQQHR